MTISGPPRFSSLFVNSPGFKSQGIHNASFANLAVGKSRPYCCEQSVNGQVHLVFDGKGDFYVNDQRFESDDTGVKVLSQPEREDSSTWSRQSYRQTFAKSVLEAAQRLMEKRDKFIAEEQGEVWTRENRLKFLTLVSDSPEMVEQATVVDNGAENSGSAGVLQEFSLGFQLPEYMTITSASGQRSSWVVRMLEAWGLSKK